MPENLALYTRLSMASRQAAVFEMVLRPNCNRRAQLVTSNRDGNTLRLSLAPVLRSRAMLQELEVKFRSSEGLNRSQLSPGSGALADLISSLACSNCLACTRILALSTKLALILPNLGNADGAPMSHRPLAARK